MKVLHVIPSLWLGDGGPAQALLSIESALAARGVQVQTATTDDAGPGRRQARELGVPVDEGGRVRRYFAKRSELYKASPTFARWIGEHVRDYDVLHLHALFTFTTTVAARAARRAGVPYVVRPLGTLDAWSLAARRPWLKQLSLRCIEAPLLRQAAAVHFTSDTEAAHAAELRIPMRPAVIPLGVAPPDEPPPRKVARAEELRILYLSRLAPKKNLEDLLRAFALLKAQRLQPLRLHLTVAGDGPPAYALQLRQLAFTLGLGADIEWLGRIEGLAKERAFSDADVFALTSQSENFGIAAAEALARGLPCVLSHGVALARDVAQAGAGIDVGTSPEEIAHGLALMIDPAARAAMSGRALALARERYSLEAMGSQLQQLYRDIAASRHGFPAAR